MLNYSITPLDPDHIDEICEDIIYQYEGGIATSALLMVKLVPEGDPAFDKAGEAAKVFKLYSERLAKKGKNAGILVQCTLGHGYVLDTPFGFQKVIGFKDGEALNVACPLDEGFRKYLKASFKTLAECRPESIMVDDDFRLMFRPQLGCGCPLHMAEFNKRAGTDLTREALFDIVKKPETAEAKRYKEIFIDVQNESLFGAARAMRAGMDEVDETILGTLSACPIDRQGEIARILAGKGNPPVMRINNGQYTAAGARGLSRQIRRAAAQMAISENEGIIMLAETDTCPQNRYSTGAQSLHAHFTGSVLAGVRGAKHWITRLAAHEPNSGKAYRRMLSENNGFYEVLSALVPDIKWLGCRIPLAKTAPMDFGIKHCIYDEINVNGWPTCVLERLGLPMFFSGNEGGAVFLDNNGDLEFSDADIEKWFEGSVFLSSGAADNLIKRGFGRYIGVSVGGAPKTHASGEIIHINGNRCNAQMQVRELKIENPDAKEESTVFHMREGKYRDPLFPGVVSYEREGGLTVTFSGTPTAEFNYIEAFSFLNESRKLQLIDLLRRSGNLPVYYPEDAEVMLQAGVLPSGELFCAVFNLGFDTLEEIPLVFEKAPSKIEMLTPKGERVGVNFRTEGDVTWVESEARTLDPAVLFVMNN